MVSAATLLVSSAAIGVGCAGMSFVPGVDRCMSFLLVAEPKVELVNVVIEGGKEHNVPFPGPVSNQLKMQFSKTTGTATGTSGVIHLLVGATKKEYTIMWSIPYDFNIYENWYDIVEGHENFKTVYKGSPTKGGKNLIKDYGHKFRGRMGNGGNATLIISLRN